MIDVTLAYRDAMNKQLSPIRHHLDFAAIGERFHIIEEKMDSEWPSRSKGDEPRTLYKGGMRHLHPLIYAVTPGEASGRLLKLEILDVKDDQSILSQRRDPRTYPELTYLAKEFERMRFYREWQLGSNSPARLPQNTDLQQDYLLEDASNLALVLNEMMNVPGLKSQLLEHMRDFSPFIEDIHTRLIGGTVQVFFHEKGLKRAIPATRLSDGSLRYLCLLAVLLAS